MFYKHFRFNGAECKNVKCSAYSRTDSNKRISYYSGYRWYLPLNNIFGAKEVKWKISRFSGSLEKCELFYFENEKWALICFDTGKISKISLIQIKIHQNLKMSTELTMTRTPEMYSRQKKIRSSCSIEKKKKKKYRQHFQTFKKSYSSDLISNKCAKNFVILIWSYNLMPRRNDTHRKSGLRIQNWTTSSEPSDLKGPWCPHYLST